MRDYDLRRGHWKNLEGAQLLDLAKSHFGTARQEGEWVEASFGALKSLKVQVLGKATLRVDTEMDQSVPDVEALDTVRTWNKFLAAATGYSAKERGKRSQEKAKKGGAEAA